MNRKLTDRSHAQIKLRRCRQPLPDTRLLYLKRPDRVVEPLELEIAGGVPEVCSNHGRAAVTLRPFRTQFFDTRKHPRAARSFLAGRNLNTIPPVSTVLVGAWPVCARCEHSARWWRRIGVALLWAMAAIFAAFVVVVAAGWAGAKVPIAVAMVLVFAFFPGSLPIGLVVALWCLRKCGRPAKFQCVDDGLLLNVTAHPDFCAASRASPGRDGASYTTEAN
ncbi:hypothetical protein [Nocardia cyriacigeorgica]|uniref:hypothetical protein n=1 Tax=Nocardia cyriacigeorgica TaxID=135487 RepID=UPI0011D19D90|nr:hypothetical protein [Nocardia cyriacigeorgica]BDT86464.1 hypothetical protein FMUAM8_22280 [Nocardia cyriacigeorgica]